MVKFCAVCGKTFSQNYAYCPNCNSVLAEQSDEFYQLTFVEPKSLKTRNLLFLGSFILMLTFAIGGTVYSLFNIDADISTLDDDLSRYVNLTDSQPLTEVDLPETEKKGKSGGGGGGGRQDDAPISKGELPPQFKDKPLLTPSKEDISANSDLKVMRGTKGLQDIIPEKRSVIKGDPNSTNPNRSNGLSPDDLGMGQNGSGGIGNDGRNGVGNKGIGGIGNADGDKYRDENGPDGGPPTSRNRRTNDNPPDFKPPTGPSIALNITAKPRATYTNEARQAALQGTVTLRVTFLANGEIGSIVVVSGLPHGLTEQAIAAARNIKFEPAKRNGAAHTVTKNVQYNFVLY